MKTNNKIKIFHSCTVKGNTVRIVTEKIGENYYATVPQLGSAYIEEKSHKAALEAGIKTAINLAEIRIKEGTIDSLLKRTKP